MPGRIYRKTDDDFIVVQRQAGVSFPAIAAMMQGRTPDGISHRYERIVSSGAGALPRTRERTCLVGGHRFYARLDRDGRFLEFSCGPCRRSELCRGASVM